MVAEVVFSQSLAEVLLVRLTTGFLLLLSNSELIAVRIVCLS